MRVLDTFIKATDKVNGFLGNKLWVGVFLIFAIILFEVVSRYFFNSPWNWTNETAQYVFAAFSVLYGGYLLQQKKHVNVEILYERFSPKGKIIARMVAFPIFLIFSGTLLVWGSSFAWESMSILEHSKSAWDPPIYPVKILIPLGAFLLLIQGVAELIRDIKQLLAAGADMAPNTIESKGEADEC